MMRISVKRQLRQCFFSAGLGVISNPLGALIGGTLAELFGRRMTLLIAAFPYVVGWLLISVSTDLYWLGAGRFVTGFAVGKAKIRLYFKYSFTFMAIRDGKSFFCIFPTEKFEIKSLYENKISFTIFLAAKKVKFAGIDEPQHTVNLVIKIVAVYVCVGNKDQIKM
jgi:hypothetical protein